MCMGMDICTSFYIFMLPFKSKSYYLQNSISILLSLLGFFIVLQFFGVQNI